MQREHLLDQDEHHAGAQQVEDEPVEADIGRLSGKSPTGTRCPPIATATQHQGERRTVQPAIAQPDQIGQGKAARDHHADQQDLAQHVDVVFLPQVRVVRYSGKWNASTDITASPPNVRAITPVILPFPSSRGPVW